MGVAGVAGAIALGVSHTRPARAMPRAPEQPQPTPPQPQPQPPQPTPPIVTPPPPPRTPLPSGPPAPMPVGVEGWRPYVERIAPMFGIDPATNRPIIPVDFVLAWIRKESAGIPGAVGFPNEFDQFGHGPLETGLFQFMSPHDIKEAGTTIDEMRAGTVTPHPAFIPGLTRASPKAQVDAARAAAQAMVPGGLTEAQRDRQIIAGLTYIANAMKLVDATGIGWSRSNPGYWALVKAHHGASSWPAAGVAMARAGLGRNPTTWAELLAGMRASPAYAAAGAKAAEHGGANPHEVAASNASDTMRFAFPKGVA